MNNPGTPSTMAMIASFESDMMIDRPFSRCCTGRRRALRDRHRHLTSPECRRLNTVGGVFQFSMLRQEEFAPRLLSRMSVDSSTKLRQSYYEACAALFVTLRLIFLSGMPSNSSIDNKKEQVHQIRENLSYLKREVSSCWVGLGHHHTMGSG